ncbi:MAG TPA: hypothetical protein VMW69_03180 [Spirochaetia bacterium]|nr:hypothetical protein [Spirochaetia bacterium]
MKLLQDRKQGSDSWASINSDEFVNIMANDIAPLLSLSRFLLSKEHRDDVLTRSFLGRLQQEATRVEELLDQFGARNNRAWFPLREQIAAARLFSDVEHILLHLQHASPVYHLLPIDEDFSKATIEAIDLLLSVLRATSMEILDLARKAGFRIPGNDLEQRFRELPSLGWLSPDRKKRHVKEPGKTVVYLATAFLNLSEESRLLEIYKEVREGDYSQCIPDSISEESLREIENKFHSLQSLYDTHISDSDIENQDRNLKIMRGHVSIIYHLLESATAFAHYYQRHINIFTKGLKWKVRYPIEPDALLRVLMTYSVAFSHRFIKAAQDLCHNILRVYAEQGKIEVTAPKYRGFHVRPSTLVAKIIMHYGSRVSMMLEEEVYDASRPLELFRANELINAKKRKFIAEQIAKLTAVQHFVGKGMADLTEGLRQVWIELLKNHKIVVYDQDFTYNELEPFEDETLAEYAKRWVAHSLALGKIDIDTDIYVTFVGDKRVLEDIRQLVEFGYGEDKYGNNLVLPARLSYLKR